MMRRRPRGTARQELLRAAYRMLADAAGLWTLWAVYTVCYASMPMSMRTLAPMSSPAFAALALLTCPLIAGTLLVQAHKLSKKIGATS